MQRTYVKVTEDMINNQFEFIAFCLAFNSKTGRFTLKGLKNKFYKLKIGISFKKGSVHNRKLLNIVDTWLDNVMILNMGDHYEINDIGTARLLKKRG